MVGVAPFGTAYDPSPKTHFTSDPATELGQLVTIPAEAVKEGFFASNWAYSPSVIGGVVSEVFS